MARASYDKCMGLILDDGPVEPDDTWHEETFDKLQRLQFYADRELAQAASDTCSAAWRWGMEGKYDAPDDPEFYEFQDSYDQAELTMLGLMRIRLGITEGDLSLPPPGYTALPETDDGLPAGSER